MTRNQLFKEILVWIFTAKEADRPERVAEVLKRISDLNLMALAAEIKSEPESRSYFSPNGHQNHEVRP